jgi:uncharacterized protein YfeS
MDFTDIWDVTPETAHARARSLIPADSILWDYGDEDSPLGNDTGADTFASYLTFRNTRPADGAAQFAKEELASFEATDSEWDQLEGDELRAALELDNGFSILTRDDVIIALAFAQLLIDGRVDPDVNQRAIAALRRQADPVVLTFRRGDPDPGRANQLAEFQAILEAD